MHWSLAFLPPSLPPLKTNLPGLQLNPVTCKTTKAAFELRAAQSTDIQKQIREDCTRFRYVAPSAFGGPMCSCEIPVLISLLEAVHARSS